MMRSYGITQLSADEIGPAYAMVRAIYPGIGLEAWRAFARPLVGVICPEGPAIVGMRTEDGYLCGLFAYRVEGDFLHERILVVDPIAVLDLIDAEPAIRSMIAAIENTAARLRCDATRIGVRGAHATLRKLLADAGYAPEVQVFTKPGAPPRES
jgi:hypothetical protein